MIATLLLFLTLGAVECNAQYGFQMPPSIIVSYGPYTAEILVENNNYRKAYDRAGDVLEAQCEAFWAQ